jgi:4-amino-4-deoxy-L-arabinose transferase-like glycosyltransferase
VSALWRTRDHAWLAAILCTAFAIRLWYLLTVTATPGFVWDDPDGYVEHGLTLVRGGRWHWTFDAVQYSIAGRQHALPPLYAVFLSAFIAFPHFPLTARLAQILLAVVAVALVFALGRIIHSPRAGLLSAAAYAIWVPNILNVWSTSQETLYIPLVLLAFVLLARAIAADDGSRRFFVAGLMFGLAALTRSMPMLFMLPAAAAHVAFSRTRRTASVQAAALLLGFGLVTVPYSIALSRHFGQTTLIDSHGSIHVSAQGDAATGRAPAVTEALSALWQEIARQPVAYLSETADRARTLFYVNGGRLLQIYVVAGNRLTALAWKIMIHLGSDIPLLASVALGAIGVAVSPVPRAALILVLWTIANVAVASLGGFGGARLRAPFEPMLLVLAAAAIVGRWRDAKYGWLAVGILTGALMTAVVLPQFARSMRAWPDYGVEWPSVLVRRTGQISSRAGVNVPVSKGVAEFTLSGEWRWSEVRVRVGGVSVQTVGVAPGENRRVRCWSPNPGLAFIELEVTEPVRITIGSP